MSNFVAKLIPFLPSSMQFEELTEAASAFNRFSERLSNCKTFHVQYFFVRELIFWWYIGGKVTGSE